MVARSTEGLVAAMGPARSRARAPGTVTVKPLSLAWPRRVVTDWLMRMVEERASGTDAAPKDEPSVTGAEEGSASRSEGKLGAPS